jgi:DNA-binding transcriptional MerR regulator
MKGVIKMLETKEIAEVLGVHSNTVRKYALALEKQGYVIHRDDNNDRKYSDIDATVFRELQALRQRTHLSVERCAEVIAARHKEPSESVLPVVKETDSNQIVQHDIQHDELVSTVQSLLDLNRQQAAELERVHKRLDDQNNNVSVILREVLETRRMVAAANARKWWEFWKKDSVLPDLNDPETLWKMNQVKPK